MGALFSFFWGTPVDPGLDIPDETTGLTLRERREVTASWELVKKDIKGNGQDLFLDFFIRYPEHQNRFAVFKGVPVSSLKGNKKLHAHATNVMYAVSSIVDNLSDPGCLVEMLLNHGRNHGKRKIPEQGFKDLKVVLIDLLKMKLGSKLTPSAAIAWDKTLDVAYSVIFKGMKEISKTEDL